MRHAKAEQDYTGKTDYERNLTEKGRKAAEKAAKKLKELGIKPDVIIASAAERTTQTAEIAANVTGFDGEIDFRQDYYFGYVPDIIEDIKILDDNNQTVMIVGHNPTMTELVNSLTESNDFFEMKTANIAVFECNINKWKKLNLRSCKLSHFIDHRKL